MAISNSDGSIVLTTSIDQSGLKKGMSAIKGGTVTAKSGVSSLTNAVKKLGTAIAVAFSVSALVKFSKEASTLATTAEASVKRLIDIYGSASQEVGNFIDANAQALGMSRAAAASYASIYGNLFSVWADQVTNAELTNEYLNMTAVVASKTGRTVEDVQERIRSGLLGNTEAIEDLGIFVNVKTIEMTDAFHQMANGRSWEQLDAYTQQQIRSIAILEQATAKYGNQVAETSSLTKSQFQAAWQDFQATWGQVVNRILVPILDVLTDILITSTAIIQSLFGIPKSTISQSETTEKATKSQKKFNEELEETQKQTKKAIAGFDDLQILTSQTSDNKISGGAIENILPDNNSNFLGDSSQKQDFSFLDRILEKIKSIKDLFMSAFWLDFSNADFSSVENLFSQIKNLLVEISSIISAIVVENMPQINQLGETLVTSFGGIVGSFAKLGFSIAKTLLGGFELYLSENKEYISETIGSIFNSTDKIAQNARELTSSFTDIIVGALEGEEGEEGEGEKITAALLAIFNNSKLAITDLCLKLGSDVIENITKGITDNKDKLKEVLHDIFSLFAGILTPIADVVTRTYQKIQKLYDEKIKPLVDTIGETFSSWVNTFTTEWDEHIKPVLDDFKEKFANVMDEHVSPALDKVIDLFGHIIDVIKELWEKWLAPFGNWFIETIMPKIGAAVDKVGDNINFLIEIASDLVGDISETLDGIVTFLEGVFTGDLDLALEGIKNAFKSCLNGIINFWESVINFIIRGINDLISNLNIIESVGEVLGQDWSFTPISEVQFPRLAQGAVIPPNREFLAVLGDQKQGMNIEAPLQTIVDAFNIALSQRGNLGGGNMEVVLEIDGREFGRAVVEQGNRENRRIGTKLVIV